MQININLELAPTHLEGRRLSLFERTVLAAIHEMRNDMKSVQDALGHAAQVEATIEEEVSTLLSEIADEQTAIGKAVSDAVTKALADAGATQEQTDAANEAAAAALDDKLTALQDKLTTALTPTPAEELPPPVVNPPADNNESANEPEPVAVPGVTITGVAGTPVSGQLTATGGTAPYTFAQTGDALGDFTVTPDGFYAMNPAGAVSGSMTYTATDADGAVSEPGSISVSISAAG